MIATLAFNELEKWLKVEKKIKIKKLSKSWFKYYKKIIGYYKKFSKSRFKYCKNIWTVFCLRFTNDHKFQRPAEDLNCKPLTCNKTAVT